MKESTKMKANAADVVRVMLPERYEMGATNLVPMQDIDEASWIWMKDSVGDNVFLRFEKEFESDGKAFRIHVSADERYVLELDGMRISMGPDRSIEERWTYKTYDIKVSSGKHVFSVVCWRIGNHAPLAQIGWHKTGGFILKASGDYDAKLTTGKATWKVARLPNPGWSHDNARLGGSFGVGQPIEISGDSPLCGVPPDNKFAEAVVVRRAVKPSPYGGMLGGWRLFPSSLPDQLDESVRPGSFRALRWNVDVKAAWSNEDANVDDLASWNALLKDGKGLIVPENSDVSLLWDLDNYYCAYPEIDAQGGKGSTVELGWAEALKDDKGVKGNRDEFVGKIFSGFTDVWRPEGARSSFALPWFRPGRWVMLRVKTGEEPLTLTRLELFETHYPSPVVSSFKSDDESLAPVQKICERGMYMCSHDMGFDCPYYEQQMYPGDTRIQLLVQGIIFPDDNLIRRDIDLFDFSRRNDGRVGFNFPTRGTQEGWTYTLIWPLMLADYAMWHGNAEWLKAKLPGLRHVMGGFSALQNGDGLLANMPPWNFMDWVPEWKGGVAPDGDKLSSINNLFYVYALKSAALVESLVGHEMVGAAYLDQAGKVAEKIIDLFWDEKRGLVADDLAKTCFSEHAQSLSLLLDILPPEKSERVKKGLLEDNDLARCTVYFSHYLFEAYAKFGRTDIILKRFDLWRDYVKLDMKTPLEAPGNARSDCHAWGSHPLYHMHANIAGVKPGSPFFKTVVVAPQPAGLKSIESETPHGLGLIKTNLSFCSDGGVSGSVTLPEGLAGEFRWRGRVVALNSGMNKISI